MVGATIFQLSLLCFLKVPATRISSHRNRRDDAIDNCSSRLLRIFLNHSTSQHFAEALEFKRGRPISK